MTPLDLLLLWLAIGAALFVAELLFTSRRDWSGLRRSLFDEVLDLPPLLGALLVMLALLFASLATLVVWCVTWPARLGWLFRWRRR